jgi:hypothetical protein
MVDNYLTSVDIFFWGEGGKLRAREVGSQYRVHRTLFTYGAHLQSSLRQIICFMCLHGL